ncbi:thermonuclease family protein [Chthonobacter albigriseus]|uniref:thermonuclease family protein n=1 Tax=Chthonobacter albigriseus TaxID=1683161 RepID=UPI0015EF9447|nr:thermonuclease family protein [Chthonobacter albigriseus]
MRRTTFGGALVALAIHLPSAPSLAMAATVRIIDGDTLAIGQETIRLHGIDAPEASQTCARPGGGRWPCGREAIRALERLAGAGPLSCTPLGKDAYDRTLAVCRSSGKDVNGAMVSSGLAWAFRKYAKDYVKAEEAAHAAGRGIWQAETEPAWTYRESRWTRAAQVHPSGCPIKGNLSGKDRIYHVPWSPWYDKTSVNEKKGERWFCSEREALAAGWRAPAWGARRGD